MIVINFIVSITLWIGVEKNLFPESIWLNFKKNNFYYGPGISFNIKKVSSETEISLNKYYFILSFVLRYKIKNFYAFLSPSFCYGENLIPYKNFLINLPFHFYMFYLSTGPGIMYDINLKNIRPKIAIESNAFYYEYYKILTKNQNNKILRETNIIFYLLKSPIYFFIVFDI